MKPGPTTEELAEIKALRREVADQQRTIEILKAATTYFAQEADPRPAVMVCFVDEHRDRWPVAVMCRTIGLPERTFHAAKTRPPSARSISDDGTHDRDPTGVGRRTTAAMGRGGSTSSCASEGYVDRPLHRRPAHGRHRPAGRATRPQAVHDRSPTTAAPRPADLVERHFVAERPNQLWLADITYVSTWQGWLYVAFILDVHSRMIVGWQLANHLRTDLVLDALEMAMWRRDLTYGELHPSLRRRLSIPQLPLHRSARRGGRRRVDRLRR